jgi:hypothetical protein
MCQEATTASRLTCAAAAGEAKAAAAAASNGATATPTAAEPGTAPPANGVPSESSVASGMDTSATGAAGHEHGAVGTFEIVDWTAEALAAPTAVQTAPAARVAENWEDEATEMPLRREGGFAEAAEPAEAGSAEAGGAEAGDAAQGGVNGKGAATPSREGSGEFDANALWCALASQPSFAHASSVIRAGFCFFPSA